MFLDLKLDLDWVIYRDIEPMSEITISTIIIIELCIEI